MSDKWENFISGVRSAAAEAGRLAEGGPLTAREFLTIKTEHFSFETLFIPARRAAPGPKRLAVSLTFGGRARAATPEEVAVVYPRWSWHKVLPEYDLLCVEDPMYKLHPDLETAWYYGDKDVFGIGELLGAVDAVRRAQGVEKRDVFFLGSSSGGYAALFLCDLMKGSSCLAMNPQLAPPNWWSHYMLANALGLDPAAPDPFGRNDISRIGKNRESRFLISCSPKSKEDFDMQVKPLFDELYGSPYADVSELPPVVIRNNFIFMFALANYPLPHQLLIDQAPAAILAGYLAENNADPDAYAWLMESCEKRWHAEQEFNCRRYWLETLKTARLANCKFPVLGWRHCTLDSADGAFTLKVEVVRAQFGRKQPVNFYLIPRGTAPLAGVAAFARSLPTVAACCKVTARTADVKVEAPDSAVMVPCLNELIGLFEKPPASA